MKWTINSLIVIVLCTSTSVTREIYSSSAVMATVIEYMNKMEFVSYLEDSVTSHKLWLTRLFNVIGQIETEEYLVSRSFSVGFPADSYRFIRHQAYVTYDISRFVRETNRTHLSKDDIHAHESMMPTETDLEGCISGLHRLADVYTLSRKEMAQGYIKRNHTRPFKLEELLTIANKSFKDINKLRSEEYFIIMDWIELAKTKLLKEPKHSIDSKKREIHYLSLRTLDRAGCVCSNEFEFLAKQSCMKRKLKLLTRKHCKHKPVYSCQSIMRKRHKKQAEMDFEKLCRGDDIEFSEDKRRIYQPSHELHCRFVDNRHPLLLLQPIKVEEIRTRKPVISKLHDVLGDNEIRYFKEKASPYLDRGMVQHSDGYTSTSKTKISQEKAINRKFLPSNMVNLMRRLAAVTNLNIKGFKDLLVAQYAAGGYYFTHIDSNYLLETPPDQYIGEPNSIASMVMYLSDVEIGGATVFPSVGAAVQAEKGSVALFYNLDKNLKMNPVSQHGGCPIALGEKWIATQWVITHHQEFLHPCTLDEND